jgi:DNA-directed RNA polymerase specialized sigma24 family protein
VTAPADVPAFAREDGGAGLPPGDGARAEPEQSTEDARDAALVAQARKGDAAALDALVRRHQAFVYNLALRMLYFPAEAEDAAQEILARALAALPRFEGRSSLRTWLYRVAKNHLLNVKRDHKETLTFAAYGAGLDATPDEDLPDPAAVPVDLRLLVDEARLGCTMAMLLCLEREARLAYVIGEIFGASDAVGAEVLELTRDAFRQRLSRARRDLHGFMNDHCGLVNPENPCRCAKKTQAFMRAGYVDPRSLLFARERVRTVREVARRAQPLLPGIDGVCADVHAAHPFHAPPDLAARVRALLARPELRAAFDL